MFFSIVSHLIINKHYPLAKLRRSTLWERLKDTFEFFNGTITEENQTGEKERSHVGLLDFLLFPVLLPLMWLLRNEPHSNLTRLLIFLKSVISFFLTVACSPFVLIGHGVSLVVNGTEDSKIKKLAITANRKIGVIGNSNGSEVHDANNADIESREVLCQTNFSDISNCTDRLNAAEYVLETNRENQENKESYLLVNNVCNEYKSQWYTESVYANYSFFDVKIYVKPENHEGIRWMLASNYSHILEKISEPHLEELLIKIGDPVKPMPLIDKDSTRP